MPTTTTDRSTPPPIHPVPPMKLPRPRVVTLSNGIPVYLTVGGTQEVLKMEVEFRAGRPYETARQTSRSVEALLRDGTRRRSGADIAETLDFYGGTFSTPSSLDNSRFALFTLSKHFGKLLPLVAEMVIEPTFPQKELNNYIERGIQRLKVDAERADIVAYREITARLFGADHPYGYNSSETTYRAQRRAALLDHHDHHFTAENCAIYLSGRPGADALELLDRYLGHGLPHGIRSVPDLPPVSTPAAGRLHLDHADEHQSAIRVARRLFHHTAPEYHEFLVLNGVLGGYFGSRLMSNLREDKGMTYGISSSLDTLHHDGFFLIGAEVGKEHRERAVEEIFHEMRLLGEELVPEEELDMVRNYLLGTLLNVLDGPLNTGSVVRSYIAREQPLDAFERMDRTIRTVTPERLRELAQKYLRPSDMWVLTVG